ncbi:MAG TPA: protein kinase [Verrucomicrobiae bacterium]
MNAPESDQRVCEQCGAPLGCHSRDGFCSRCIARISLVEAENDEEGSQVREQKTADRARPPLKARFGDYELLEEIAHGGMGVVYRARQVSLNRIVAVKMLLFGQFAGKTAFERFRAEAQTAAQLQHPNIVAIHEIGEIDGQPYFSMDYVAGRNLADLVRDRPMAARQAAVYVRKIALAVQYAHNQGVLHRDLKPANVLIDGADEPRVTDFGLARRLVGDSELTLTGQVVGSPNFMPPEQGAAKKARLGPASDVYGLGALLYCLLTARPPFVAETFEATLEQVLHTEPVAPRQLNPGLPLDLETICLKCLEKDPARRYASAAELANELDRFLTGEPIHARPVGSTGKLWRWCRRKPVAAAMSGAVIALLLTVTAVSLTAARRIAQHARELRLNLYVADMNVAYQAIRDNNLGMARQLLDNYRPQGQKKPGKSQDRPVTVPEEDLRGWEWRYLWSLCRGDSIATLRGHSGAVTCAVLAPDGKVLVTGSFDQSVRIWDVATRRSMRTLTGFARPLQRNSVALSPDGNWLAVADSIEIHVFETATWKKVRTLPNPALPGYVESLPIAFSPDGKTLSCNAETEIRRWNTTSWEPLASWPTNLADEFGLVLAYSPDGRHFATAKHEGIAIWDTFSNPPRQRLLGPLHWPFIVTFSPDGRKVAAGGGGEEAIVWDVAEGKEMARLALGGTATLAYRMAWSPDGTRLAVGGGDPAIALWDVEQRKLAAVLKGAYGGGCLAFSLDGQTLVSGCGDGTVRLFSALPEAMPVSALTSGCLLCFSADGSKLAVLGTNCCVEYWDVRSRQMVASFRIPGGIHERDCVTASPDGTMVALVCIDGMARVWDVGSGQQIAMLPLDPPPKLPLSAFSPDSRRLVICCNTRTRGGGGWTLMWDFRRGEVRKLPGADIYRPSFSQDGKMVATACDTAVQVWSVPDLKVLATFKGHSSAINGLAFSPDGAWLASMERGSEIRTWEIANRRLGLVFSVKARGNGLRAGAFSPDGRTLVSGSNLSPELWNVATGRKVLPLKDTPGYLSRPMFSSDGRTLVLGRSDDARAFRPVVLLEAPSLAEIEAAEKAEADAAEKAEVEARKGL